MGSAWATGKTLCAIQRSLIYAKGIPNSLGIIFRKEYTDLRDSTIKDFEAYTGLKLNSQRDVPFDNGSVIMFRHIAEVNKANLQNINLNFAFIEQAEELPTDEEFFLLWGRLRRAVNPSPEFVQLGLNPWSIWVIANAGDNWVRRLWKKDGIKDPVSGERLDELIEATTFDNADNLPAEYIKTLHVLKEQKPEIYKRYVLNDWDARTEGKIFSKARSRVAGEFQEPQPGFTYTIGVDLAKTIDYTAITVLNNQTNHVDYFLRLENEGRSSWNLQKENIKAIALKYNDGVCVVDASGPGDPVVEDLQRAGVRIWHQKHGEEKYTPGFKFTSISKENIIEKLQVAIEQGLITYPKIDVLLDELDCFETQYTSSGNIKYGAPAGKHDDCVISLALALWGQGGRMYETYIPPKPQTEADLFWDMVKKDIAMTRREGTDSEDIRTVIE
jgi:hypothetical protein